MIIQDLWKAEVGHKNAAEFIDRLYSDTLKRYLKLHRDWYIYERFVRGDHWIVFNKTLNKIQVIPIQDGEIRRTINKIRSQLRGVKNFIKRNQPRWEVQPDDVTDEAYEEARKKNKILQYLYRTLGLRSLLTDIIVSGLKYSVGILEVGVVEEDGKQKIKMWYNDPFDIFIDPFARDLQSARFIIKKTLKPLSEIKNNSKYDFKGELKAETEDLNYKQLLRNEKYGSDKTTNLKDLEEIIVKEIYLKKGEGDNVKIRILTVINGQLVRVQEPHYRRYPMFIFNPEKDPGAIYSDSWIKDLISLNKSLDKGASQIEGYIQRMLAGKYLIKQGVQVSTITDKGAEKIYYKGSVPPTQLNLQPLPAAPFNHLHNCERWLEELGGIREASLGRIPGSLQSGKAIEALQAADAGTVSEPVENLENFLAEVGEFLLELIADYQLASEEIVEDKEKIKYIGNIASKEELPEDALVVKPAPVKVTIVPEIAYSEEAKFTRLLQLASAGLVDPQTVLEKLNVSNISEILERVEKMKEEEFKKEMVRQKESHRTSGEAPEDTADLADQENKQMALGQTPPLTPRALWTPEHTDLHLAFIEENQDAYQANKDIFDEHIKNEEQYAQ